MKQRSAPKNSRKIVEAQDPPEKGNSPLILVRVTPIKPVAAAGRPMETTRAAAYTEKAPPGEGSILEELSTQVYEAVTSMTEKFARALAKIADECKPSEFSVKFSLSFTEKGGILITSGEAQQEFEVNLKWDLSGGKSSGDQE